MTTLKPLSISIVGTLALLSGGTNPAIAQSLQKVTNFCEITATNQRSSCRLEANEDFYESKAVCNNLPIRSERLNCKEDARNDRTESLEFCEVVRDARSDVCDALGGGRYDPDFDPKNFVSDPTEIGRSVDPNPYFPLVVGNRWVYEEDDEIIEVTVKNETKLIEGVRCLTVNDIVSEEGEPVEDTDDWYAQDLDGNVWYCGEISLNYELFEGDDPETAELVDLDGSWKAGRDGAKAGIIMFADPVVGTTYRQEYAIGEAEDIAQVVSLTGTESTEAASCAGDCVVTFEYTPVEPGNVENKYYAPGVGLFLEQKPDGTRVELIEFSTSDLD